eukprot:TRINITY_DN40200_c0_g1_i1.p1 TRINITY_DN40200_c0_g1~~TRINITY_DN40200_c0_g1_i1.p1  ORF type:complete len:362 (+),score=41.66 TRINITY_DN40200_c0_g1_i1:67-1152(+)
MAHVFFRTVYTYRYVRIESAWLGVLYFGGILLIGIWSLIQCFMQHSYVIRPQTYIETTFWRYSALDGNWWYQNVLGQQAPYCGRRYWWANDSAYGFWGSDNVTCRRPETDRTTFFYYGHNSLQVATSIAYGNELNATDIYVYEDIDKVSIAFQINYFNDHGTAEVRGCRAFDTNGRQVESRRSAIAKAAGDGEDIQSDGVLLLTVDDLLRAAGKDWNDLGDDLGVEGGLPLRLQGIEVVAEVKLRNYHQPFRMTNETECSVSFRVFRNQFTEVQRFYRGEELLAIQHGLRVRVVGSASLGYPSFVTGLQTFALGLCMATCLGTVVEFAASMIHPRRERVNDAMCKTISLDHFEGAKHDKAA